MYMITLFTILLLFIYAYFVALLLVIRNLATPTCSFCMRMTSVGCELDAKYIVFITMTNVTIKIIYHV